MLTAADRLFAATPMRAALTILLLAGLTIAGAWMLELYGYAPCDLCLQQRLAYYIGVPLAAATVLIAWRGPQSIAKSMLILLALIFAGSAIFGAYHAGVEWGFWPGPAGCTGNVAQKAPSMADFMNQLKTVKVVRCDVVALRIFGLSLAGWNAVLSVFMTIVAVRAIMGKNP